MLRPLAAVVVTAVIAAGALGALGALASCGKGGGANEPAPGDKIDERQACTVDTDCLAVEIGCCDHCNGGTAVGVHRDFATDVRKQYAPAASCEGTACTRRGCEPALPICRVGRCGVSIGGAEDLSPLPRP